MVEVLHSTIKPKSPKPLYLLGLELFMRMLVVGLEPLHNSETRIERSFERPLIVFAYILHTNSLFCHLIGIT